MATKLPSAGAQRGVAVVALVIVLLITMTLAAAFVNRSLLFEQRGVSNRHRATRAASAADAGLDWARAMLNDDGRPVAHDCQAAATGPSFRDIVLRPGPTGVFDPDDSAAVACLLAPSGLRCSCTPAASPPIDPAGLPADDTLRFDVRFTPVPGDGRAVALTVHGCTDASVACRPDSSAPLEAIAMAGVMLKALDTADGIGSAGDEPASAASAPRPAAPASGVAPLVIVSGSWHDS